MYLLCLLVKTTACCVRTFSLCKMFIQTMIKVSLCKLLPRQDLCICCSQRVTTPASSRHVRSICCDLVGEALASLVCKAHSGSPQHCSTFAHVRLKNHIKATSHTVVYLSMATRHTQINIRQNPKQSIVKHFWEEGGSAQILSCVTTTLQQMMAIMKPQRHSTMVMPITQ